MLRFYSNSISFLCICDIATHEFISGLIVFADRYYLLDYLEKYSLQVANVGKILYIMYDAL